MPAAPEVLDRGRGVRGVEVLREAKPEQERQADRDVRVSEEVGVDLDRVGVDPDQHLERGVLVRRPEDLVDDVRGQVVGDHHLHEEARADQEEGARGVDVARIPRRVELRDQLSGADDRSGDQMREEREVGGELPEAGRREVAAIDVDDVADRHEREEGDPDREDDRARLERDVDPERGEQVVRRRDEEVVVLEVAEQGEVPGERSDEEPLPRAGVPAGMDREGEDLVPRGSRTRAGIEKRQSQPA